MEKIIASICVGFFVLVEHARQLLMKPRVWLVIVAILVLGWSFSSSGPALFRKARPQPLPIVFQPDPRELTAVRHDVIESAVGRFHMRHGRLPRDWAEMDADNIITRMPPPPPGKKYVLSPSKMELTVADK